MHMIEIITAWDGDVGKQWNMHPTHGLESKDPWGQPRCTSWKWGGKPDGIRVNLGSKTTMETYGSQTHNMVWAYLSRC
eukprot:9532118-Karenia_brevis.AAC.1